MSIDIGGIDLVPTLAVQAAAYSSGHCIGGLLTLSGLAAVADRGASLMLTSAMLKCKVANVVEIDALIFRSQPSGFSTFIDRNAAVLDPSDMIKVGRVIQFNSWISPVGNCSFSQVDLINRLMSLPSGQVDAYVALIAKGAITFTGTADLSFVATALWN
jgi:hypothetical protein